MVAIAGVTGFVGEPLARALRQHAGVGSVVGIGRGSGAGSPVDEWRKCDLFSLADAERALVGVDVAVYLVHSMMPSAALTQGNFADFDLIAADNFARAAARNGVRQIVYLGGLVPSARGERPLSRHLESRLEVERVLAAHGTPVTALRAGLVVGPAGSSFLMLRRLVERLPVMLTPAWTETRTQPIDLADVVALLLHCVGRPETFGQSFDVGGPEVLTYRKMIERLAAKLGRHPRLYAVPFFTPGLSRLWVSLVTGAPKSLVAPLVESLTHEMVAGDRRLQDAAAIPGRSFDESLDAALEIAPPPDRREGRRRAQRDVRSVQRLPLPEGRDARWVADEYLRWLPRLVPFALGVHVADDQVCRFTLLGVTLLVLAYAPERSSADRALFYVRGGVLADMRGERGRLEFRSVPRAPFVIAAIHDFVPRLPWLVYATTQARFHLAVMRAFGRHLARSNGGGTVRGGLRRAS